MGKIVKYCANCEESFAEKFSFCPNCAAGLTAYEMNPVAGSPIAEPIKVEEPVKTVEAVPEPIMAEKKDDYKTQIELPTSDFSADDNKSNDDLLDIEDEAVEEPKAVFEEKPAVVRNTPVTILPAAVAPVNADDYARTYKASSEDSGHTADYKSSANGSATADDYKTQVTPINKTYNNDGGYNITFVEEKNNGVRRGLLLGAFLLVTITALSGIVISLYTSDALVGSLNEDMVLLAPGTIDTVEEPPDPEPPKPKNADQGGGGGGGGKEAKTETSKGVLATQMEKPMIAPSAEMVRVTKPAIPITAATEGKNKIPPSNEPYGNPNSLSTIPSDGTGSGGGQGSGIGRGQGSGRGGGAGSGIGTGMGGGIGNGNGNGIGDGDGGPPAIKPPPPVGPTEAIRITSKPRANYTDAARQNQVQGTVTLRVTFLANGSIGSISTVSGLPNGLTEQAIAAARGMRFEPAKKGGVPYTVTKQVQYNFTLY